MPFYPSAQIFMVGSGIFIQLAVELHYRRAENHHQSPSTAQQRPLTQRWLLSEGELFDTPSYNGWNYLFLYARGPHENNFFVSLSSVLNVSHHVPHCAPLLTKETNICCCVKTKQIGYILMPRRTFVKDNGVACCTEFVSTNTCDH